MRQVIVAGMLAAAMLLGLAPARAEELTFDDEKVADAIERAKTFLLSAQLPNGSWSKEKLHDVGITAMCTYALLEAGVKPTQENVKKALTWLTEQNCTYTYSLALRCQAYLSAEKHGSRGAYKAFLKKDAELLAHSGLVNGGRYSYNTPGAAGDNSNSQYGLLGVWAAAQLGLEVPEGYWERVAKHWQGCQGADGGWHYDATKPAPGKAFATMTVAGIASVLVCFEQLTPGAFADCRGPNQPAAVENGLDWMERYFVEIVGGAKAATAAREFDKQRKDKEAEETKKILSELSPDDRQRFQQEENKRQAEERKRQRPAGELHGFTAPGGWMYYFLYGVERVGLASGYKYFGTADWYKVGAERLLNEQSKNGRWGAELHNTAFATIFLVRGRHPILFNKLSYRGRWRNRPHDLPNLAKWIGDNSETTVNWQSINPSVPVRDWHDAPIVYIAGSTAPYFTPAEIAKLRRYVEEGGTILSVAECGGADFKSGIRLAYQKIFPQYEMTAIKPDHEMNTALALVPVAPAALPPMFTISNGIRPLAVHIEGDLPKSWQMRRVRGPETAFEIGANVTQYIAGLAKDLRPRGASPWPDRTAASLTGKDIRLVRLKHAGYYDGEPLAYDRFSLMMANRHRFNVLVPPPVEAAALSPDKAHLAVLAGTGKLTMTGPETDALRAYVYAGGTLLVEALGGNEEFARSARTMLSDVFGAAPARLEPAHALYQMPGLEIAQFRYRRKAQRRLGRDSGPALEAISYKDRPAVFLSREDLSAALLGYQGMGVDGYTPETAFEIVRNLAVLASGQVPTTRPATAPAGAARPSPAPAGTKVDVKGEYENPNDEIGPGAIANMTANTTLGWQTGTCHIDVITNGFDLTLDSGGGNALNYTGVISGTGNVTLLMGPSSTGFKDAPLQLGGKKPNTTTGKFIARKGRVQLEKPDRVDAISGDVTVGGQGANDCLHWVNSNQIKDTVTITVLNAGNQGGAYLSLNGCKETVAALVLAADTTVKTDSPQGQKGVLTVKSLMVNAVKKPAGTYTAATEKWIEGIGKVVVLP